MKLKGWVYFVLVLVFFACSSDAIEFELISSVSQQTEKNYILLEPEGETLSSGFIFYPGALVESEAYISLLQHIADAGIRVIILKATADLAIFNVNRAEKVKADFEDVEHWIVGGHSLGGVVAVKVIVKNPDEYDGLILLASYPAGKDDLSKWDGAVLSITAEHDLLTTQTDIENTVSLLSDSFFISDSSEFPNTSIQNQTIYYEIAGGNHAQFGNYGEQKDDGVATITKEEQHDEIINMILLFFSANGWD